MSAILPSPPKAAIHYPDSDGRRMAENTVQFQWIQTIFANLTYLFRDRTDVFVAGDNLWYPVEGKPKRRAAPDVYVVFGRPKGRRGSYKQWEEGDVPLTVAFEVPSPGNRFEEMLRKFKFYDRYGVEEYYLIDPDRHTFAAWHRGKHRLLEVRVNGGLVSPRLGVRFEWHRDADVVMTHPDGKPFLSVEEIAAARDRAETKAAALAAKLRELGIDPDAV